MAHKKSCTTKKQRFSFDLTTCPVMTSLSIIGGKWKPAILYAVMQEEVLRFGELKRSIEGITQKMLTSQLRELEADGIVHREVYAEVPPRVEYRMTDYGKTLLPLLRAMADWGVGHRERQLMHKNE